MLGNGEVMDMRIPVFGDGPDQIAVGGLEMHSPEGFQSCCCHAM
jgi:hypothetical protein